MALRFAQSEERSTLTLIGPRTGAQFKYQPQTGELLITNRSGVIETYFKPRPEVHKLGTNLEYFLKQYDLY